MSRLKTILAVLLLTAIVAIVPQAQAQAPVLKTVIVGSSALWQTLALGAYNNGTSLIAPTTSTAVTACNSGTTPAGNPTHHYTNSSVGMNAVDSRGGFPLSPTIDNNAVWIVWDSCENADGAATPNVWLDVKIDSVAGNRCYFADPKCKVTFPGTSVPAVGNKISVWPDNSSDVLPPTSVSGLFVSNSQFVTVAATDIRPEDAAWAACRTNSPLGASTASGFTNSDGFDGLGYSQSTSAVTTPGACYQYAAATEAASAFGNAIVSGFPGATNASNGFSNVASFNIIGKDPANDNTLPAYPSIYEVGAAPIVFLYSTLGTSGTGLSGLTTATEQQLQQAFSGTNCSATAFSSPSFTNTGAINIFLREPNSGTYNTAEATVFRYPVVYPAGPQGLTQELYTGNPASKSFTLNQTTPCHSGGGFRYRAIGTSSVVTSVQCSIVPSGSTSAPCGTTASGGAWPGFDSSATGQDGIGYIFFSYGNVSPSGFPDNASYNYIKLDGVDPIWASYFPGIDPGQPTTAGELPSKADFPSAIPSTTYPYGGCGSGSAGSGTYPCPENLIWGGGLSFPNVRNGTYRAWSLLRLVATGTPGTNAAALITASQKYAVLISPDYVPATAVTLTAAETSTATKGVFDFAITDPGLKLLRSHYLQYDGAGISIPVTTETCVNQPAASERCGDMGGLIIPTTVGVTLGTHNPWLNELQVVQSSTPDNDLSPAPRPKLP